MPSSGKLTKNGRNRKFPALLLCLLGKIPILIASCVTKSGYASKQISGTMAGKVAVSSASLKERRTIRLVLMISIGRRKLC